MSPLSSPPDEQSPSGERNAVMLGPRDRLIGRLYIEGDLHVNGTVEGAVEATGDVEIDDMAKVKASVAGRQVSIRGQVSGPVTARKRLVVAHSGSLIGDVRVPRLVVQDGATLSGNVLMGPDAEMAPKAAEPADPVTTAAERSAPKAQDVAVIRDDGKARRAGNKRKPNRR
jgi:cytoskeletal protein CcmA (bactofilin family)